ncbi:MAG: GNAT family N-acetyltransferase [Flaviflexus sp.]|nr:GNAT family N-acetyltransferase [Flaviflexus sp.]
MTPQWTDRSDRVLWSSAGPDHGLFVSQRGAKVEAILLGQPDLLIRELAAYAHEHGDVFDRALLERSSADAVLAAQPSLFGPQRGDEWDFLYATRKPEEHPLSSNVRELDRASEGEDIRSVIHRSIPGTWALGVFDECRWVGYVEDGQILSAIAILPASRTEDGEIITQLAGFGTLPEARGRGIGAAVMSTITRATFDLGPVGFGMWRDNDVARGLYTKLGFTVDVELVTVKKGSLERG